MFPNKLLLIGWSLTLNSQHFENRVSDQTWPTPTVKIFRPSSDLVIPSLNTCDQDLDDDIAASTDSSDDDSDADVDIGGCQDFPTPPTPNQRHQLSAVRSPPSPAVTNKPSGGGLIVFNQNVAPTPAASPGGVTTAIHSAPILRVTTIQLNRF